MTFFEKYKRAVADNNSYVCVGLDSDYEKLPQAVMSSMDPQAEFNKSIINATCGDVCAYKINIAFYECRGAEGWESLEATVNAVPDNIPVIIDAKRGDIGNTSAKYAEAIYDRLNADAVTVNPYLGFDSIAPFLKYKSKCAFVLCHTSNPSSKEFQHAKIVDNDISDKNFPLYELVAGRVAEWNKTGDCGLVVGANVPEYLSRIIELAPGLPLLIPGIGAQKGDAGKIVGRLKGVNFLINSSRGIIFASSGEDFPEKAARQTLTLKNTINDILHSS